MYFKNNSFSRNISVAASHLLFIWPSLCLLSILNKLQIWLCLSQLPEVAFTGILLLSRLWEINLRLLLRHQSLCQYMDLYWLNLSLLAVTCGWVHSQARKLNRKYKTAQVPRGHCCLRVLVSRLRLLVTPHTSAVHSVLSPAALPSPWTRTPTAPFMELIHLVFGVLFSCCLPFLPASLTFPKNPTFPRGAVNVVTFKVQWVFC